MPTYNDANYLTLPQQVEKNRLDIATLEDNIEEGAVGPQGVAGPRGPQGIQGIEGPVGPDGTPVAGIELSSLLDAVLNLQIITIDNNVTPTNITYKYTFNKALQSELPIAGFWLYQDGIKKDEVISQIGLCYIRLVLNEIRMSFYDEIVNQTKEYQYDISVHPIIIASDVGAVFTMSQLLNGSTVGPAGEQGIQGIQGATGPTGAQGVQGLPGPKNMTLLDTYETEDTFTEYAYRVMVQIVGGDYDGLTFIKEALEEDDTVKFGPYATLVTIEDNGGTIQCILQNGVTSIRVYKVDNIS